MSVPGRAATRARSGQELQYLLSRRVQMKSVEYKDVCTVVVSPFRDSSVLSVRRICKMLVMLLKELIVELFDVIVVRCPIVAEGQCVMV
jgi:hypothetical protein